MNTTGASNTALGNGAGLSITGDGNVCIGALVIGAAGLNDTTWIRNINTTPQSVSANTNNYVTVRMTDGRLGYTTIVSSRRYKEDIKPMDNASQALFALKPVTFRYKKEIDQSQSTEYGLVAEDVAQVDSNLAIRDKNGQIDSVRYSAVNAMLLNEFLKEHKKVEEQQATITQLKKDFDATIAHLTARLDEQAAQIQKVSAQLELSKSAAQTVLNNPWICRLAISPCQADRNSSRLGVVWNRGQGRKLFSRSFLPLFQTCTAKGQPTGGKPTKENKHETSKLNSHSDGDCLHWAFATSAGSQPATPRGLSQLHHCCGGPRPSGSHLGPWEHSNWYVFVV